MKIVDSHIHTTFHGDRWGEYAKSHGIDYSDDGLLKEMKTNSVEYAVTIYDLDEPTPMGVNLFKAQSERNKSLIGVAGLNPYKITKDSIVQAEQALASGAIRGLKVFAGYYPFGPGYRKYYKFYKMAAKHNVPVIIHCGDLFPPHGRLRYSHPLQVDDVAVDFPDTKFVIAHAGNPWIIDAGEVAYKNPNVYIDTSGLVDFNNLYAWYSQQIQWLFGYVDDPNRIMYGSDWPLVNMQQYIKFMYNACPKQWREKFFYENAKKLFNIK